MLFDFEREWCGEIEAELTREVAFARSLLLSLMKMDFRSPTNGISMQVFSLALSQVAKSMKTFRSIIALCELGRADDIDILLRSQLESIYRLQFLLQDTIVFDGQNVTREERAHWIVLQIFFQNERLVQSLETTHGFESVARQKRKELESIRPMAQKYIDMIDPSRVASIQNSAGRHFCCLSTRELASRVNLPHVHSGLYGYYSMSTHANDFDRHLEFSGKSMQLKWKNDASALQTQLLHSCRLMLTVTFSVNETFELGQENSLQLLFAELQSLEQSQCD